MKPREAKALIQSCIDRGYVMHGDKLLTPDQAKELNIQPEKKKRAKKGEAQKFSDKQDDFCFFVRLHFSLSIVTEYQFEPSRRWRFDYAIEAEKIAIEQEGGVWSGGRHTRGQGYIGDMEKYNAAALAGWTLIRRTPDQMKTAETIELIRKALQRNELNKNS